MGSLRERLERVSGRIEEAARRSGRNSADIRLVAISKTVPPEVIVEAYRLGQAEFGENRVQEFREKRATLEAAGVAASFHMVGHLQTNKAKLASGLFDIIQSLDSPRLARVLDREARQAGRKLPVLLEVDFSADPDRTGFEPERLETDAGEVVGLSNLEVRGLMTVAPLGLDQDGVRAVFRRMRDLQQRLTVRYPSVVWEDLSMGMSDDFEAAIEEGATIVRIGRAIFGEREARPSVNT